MSAKLRFLETFLSSILFLGMAAPAVANDITVTVQPWGQTQVNTFDPNKAPGTTADPNKPGDLPGPPVNSQNQPLIPPNESAVAVADLDPNFTVDTSAPDTDGKVTITHIDVTIAGSTTIYLPTGATRQQ